jgi:L-ribulose-5-phosphate 3-epimerase
MANVLAGHTNSYHTYSLEDALRGIANAGFKNVELSAVEGWTEHIPLGANDSQLNEVHAKLNEFGLTPVVLSGHSDLTTPAGLETGKKAATVCQKLGLTTLITAVGGHYKEGEDKEAFLRYIGDLAGYCAERGITIGLEVHGEVMASGKASLPVLEEIGQENVKLNYDTANCEFYGGVQAVDDLPPVVSELVLVHLKDKIGGKGEWNFPAVGEGHVDFAKILQVLRDGGYSGPLSVEIEFQGEPWPPLSQVDRAFEVSYRTLSNLGLE